MRPLPKVLISILVIGVVASSAFLISNAFFSDTETSSNNSFTAGKLDLKINKTDNPSAIVTIGDFKPGDDRTIDKTITIDNNPAWVWMHLKELVATQGVQTEPEITEESGPNGERSDIQNYMDYDLSVQGAPIINSSDHIRLPDAVSCWIPLGQIPGGSDIPMQQSFHFDKEVGNWAQGDVLTFTEDFYATQVRNNPNPSPPDTGTGRIWSPELKKCLTDVKPLHNLTFTCISGCGGTYAHTLNISSFDTVTGNFSGTGFYNPDNSYTWTITGNTSGTSFTAHILYTGSNPGYFVDLIGVAGSLQVTGSAGSSAGQTFTFTIN